MLLRLLLSFLCFPIVYGLSFDNFLGNATAGTPITLTWHRKTNDSNQIAFLLRNRPGEASLQGLPLLNATDTTQLDGTVEVNFPGSGEYTVEATINQNGTVGTIASQRFDVAGSESPSSPTQALTNTASPNSKSKHRRAVIVGAVLGTIAALVLIMGGVAFLLIRRQRRRNWKHRRLSSYPKIHPKSEHGPEQAWDYPAVGNEASEPASPILEVDMTPHLRHITTDAVEQSREEISVEDEGERRDNADLQSHDVHTSEPQNMEAPNVQEGPHSVQEDVAAEVLRLRLQVQQLMERQAERTVGIETELGPPPAYE